MNSPTQADIISQKMERFFGVIYREDWNGVTDQDLEQDFEKYWAGAVKPAEDAVLRELDVPQLILKSSDLTDFSNARLERAGLSIKVVVEGRTYAIIPYVTYGGVLRNNTIIVPRPQMNLSPLLKKRPDAIVNPDNWIWYGSDAKLSGFMHGRNKLTAEAAFEALRFNQREQLRRQDKTGLELNAENLEEILEGIEEFDAIPVMDLREFQIMGIDDMFDQIRKVRQVTSKRSRYVLKYGDQINATYDDTEQNNPNVIVHIHKGNYKLKVDKYTSTIVSLASQYTKNREIRGITYYYDPVFITDNRKAGLIFKLKPGVEIKEGTLFLDGKSPWDLTEEEIQGSIGKVTNRPYIQNNKLKRQWMYEKFLDQAMYLSKEDAYQLTARVVLTEYKGATLESGIVISESFAERAETYHEIQIKNDDLALEPLDVFAYRYPELYEKARDLKISQEGPIISAQFKIPLSIGDKLTNMHGNKGTISLILPDDQMPYITSTIGDVEPGPAEILLSNNIVDRGTYGQLVEIFSISNDRPDIQNIKDFLESGEEDNTLAKVIIEGEEFERTSGLMNFCVMEHFASIKQTIPGQKFLKIGEMECLLIAGLNQNDLLREVLATSPTRRSDYRAQRLTKKPAEGIFNNSVIDILNSLGLDIKIDNKFAHSFNTSIPTESEVEEWKKNLADIIG